MLGSSRSALAIPARTTAWSSASTSRTVGVVTGLFLMSYF